MNSSSLKNLNRGNPGNKGGSRPKSKVVKTAQEFRASKIHELPIIWQKLTDIENDPTVPWSEKIKVLQFKFDHIAGKAMQPVSPVDGNGNSIIVTFKEKSNATESK